MAIKHKVLKDFQLLTDDKKIIILKAKTVIEDYKFKNKSETVSVPVDIIKNNPDYFSFIDWKEELQSYLKVNKIAQPAVITKKLVPFIETMMDQGNTTIKEVIVEKEVIKEVIVEKPKVIEKEVIVEKMVSDQSLSIELETKLKKLQLKENQLDKEIEEASSKEIEATNREKRAQELEKTYTEKLKEVEDKEIHLNSKEIELSEKELRLNEKESNLLSYVTRGQISQKIDEYAAKGFQMDFFRNIMNEI
jgi:seryl-tRNA synthetase